MSGSNGFEVFDLGPVRHEGGGQEAGACSCWDFRVNLTIKLMFNVSHYLFAEQESRCIFVTPECQIEALHGVSAILI